MEKSIVNIGDNIWYRRRMLNERTTYGKVIKVENHCIVTIQGCGFEDTVNLCAIKGYWYDNDGECKGVVEEYVWGKCEPLIKK